MYLVYFLTIGTIFSLILGEFGHFPFGASGAAVSLTDLMLSLTLIFLLIWKVGIQKDFKLPKVGWGLVVFWAVAALSLAASGNLKGGLYLIRYIIYSSSFFLGYFMINSKVTTLNTLFKTITWAGLTLAFLGFLQLIFIPDLVVFESFGFDPHKNRLTSTLLDPNFMGAMLNFFILVSFNLWEQVKQRKYLVFIGIFLIALILTFSRSAYLMLGVEILILGLFQYRKLLFGALVTVLVLYLVLPSFSNRINGALSLDKSSSERIISWQNGLRIFSEHPLLGVGFDNLRDSFAKENLFKVFSENGGHSGAGVDSSLIFILATTGVSGLISFLYWNFYLLKKIQKTKYFLFWGTFLLGLLVNSQFINSWFFPPIMLLFYLISGSMVAAL